MAWKSRKGTGKNRSRRATPDQKLDKLRGRLHELEKQREELNCEIEKVMREIELQEIELSDRIEYEDSYDWGYDDVYRGGDSVCQGGYGEPTEDDWTWL